MNEMKFCARFPAPYGIEGKCLYWSAILHRLTLHENYHGVFPACLLSSPLHFSGTSWIGTQRKSVHSSCSAFWRELPRCETRLAKNTTTLLHWLVLCSATRYRLMLRKSSLGALGYDHFWFHSKELTFYGLSWLAIESHSSFEILLCVFNLPALRWFCIGSCSNPCRISRSPWICNTLVTKVCSPSLVRTSVPATR